MIVSVDPKGVESFLKIMALLFIGIPMIGTSIMTYQSIKYRIFFAILLFGFISIFSAISLILILAS